MRFPFFEVVSHETGRPVSVVVWHVRSVRPIRNEDVGDGAATRIEFANGDVLDCSDSVSFVLSKMDDAFGPFTEWLSSVANQS